ncbi:MAG: hypothetical protein ABUT39_28970 [Acidobacteriota bacterium]
MQSLTEDEREPAEPAEARISPLPRRLLLHATLAVAATPLPGGLLLGARWIAARRTGAGRLAAAAALAVIAAIGLGLGIGLLAPLSLRPAAAAIWLVWLAAGLGLGWLESRAGLAPEVPWTEEPRTGVQILVWSAAFAVVGVLLAFGLATVTTRWGDEIFAKPSAPRQVLRMVLLVLMPAGALTGLVRGALRRPFRMATPVVFAASCYFVGLAFVGAEPLFKWLARGLSRTDELIVSNGVAPSETVFLLLAAVFYLAAALYLAESRRTLELIQRSAAVAALAFLFFGSFDLACGDGPVSWRNRWATTTAGQGRHADAARHWAWAVARAPRDNSTAGLAIKGAREALLAGDPALARTLLSRIDDGLVREHPSGLDEAGTARALLATRLDLAGLRRVEVAPVSQEGSLDTSWSALLTAARVARPELGESEVKQKLQDLAGSASSTDLPELLPLQQLRVVADLFGARAAAFPWSARDRVLTAGAPVLVRVPPSGHWILIFWSAPGADAVLTLDYTAWGMDKEDVDQDEVARLLVGGEGPESRAVRAQARVAVLRSASRLGALLARDGGMAFALVPPRTTSPILRALPDLPSDLATLELARREMERRAFGRGLALAVQVPPGPARDELLAYAWLDPEGRKRLAGEEAAAGALAGRLAGRAGSASPWLIEQLVLQAWDDREPYCALREALLRASLELQPKESWHALELAAKAAATGRPAEAAAFAARSAASHNWSSGYVLEALEPLALMPGASSDPGARAALEELLDRVSPLVESRSEASDYTLRSAYPEYQAARAALARDPGEAAERWRRAVELRPKSAAYRLRLAEALDRAGRADEAREARRWADAVGIEPLCPGGKP